MIWKASTVTALLLCLVAAASSFIPGVPMAVGLSGWLAAGGGVILYLWWLGVNGRYAAAEQALVDEGWSPGAAADLVAAARAD